MKFTQLPNNLLNLCSSLTTDFDTLAETTQQIRIKLQAHADSKLLKGDEITGWLGEVYGKILFNGTLMPDEYDYDVVAPNMRISVKARKGETRGWEITSIIPRIEGRECPTHLMFMQFTQSYSLLRIWLYPWEDLFNQKRFIEKKVRNEHRGYYVRISPIKDKDYLVYWDNPSWRLEMGLSR
jgi:hypothetical protein